MKTPAALFSFALSLTIAPAAVVYDEGISGDLSGAFGAPDPIVLSAGANTVIGQMGNNGDTGATNGQDADYLSFTVGAGSTISTLVIDLYVSLPDSPGGGSLLAYTSGAAFTGQGGGDIDGNVIFNGASGDVLPALAGGPLGAGTYSFWLQETSSNVVDYQITFTQIPEPSAGALAALAACGLCLRRRR